MKTDDLTLSLLPTTTFPETKYMGSKRRLLPFIQRHLEPLKFSTVLDGFSGTSCVAYLLKQMGKTVHTNDFLRFCYHIAHATIENERTKLSQSEVSDLLCRNSDSPTFIRDTYADVFFNESDCEFLDNLWLNISRLKSKTKRSIAFAAAARACMKKRPRGLFTTTGRKGWDSRRDLRLSMQDQFVSAVHEFNGCVFANEQSNRAFNQDIFTLPKYDYDLVYLDPPYVSQFSDCDYVRRYHFVEGFCTYWKNVKIDEGTKTKKFRSYPTSFSSRNTVIDAFRRLFRQFPDSILVVSYSSNGIPNREELVELLFEVRSLVKVNQIKHRYHHGNHKHRIDDNNNSVIEYLFVAK